MFPFLGVPLTRPGEATVARFSHQTQVGKSVGRQLASPADLPTKVS